MTNHPQGGAAHATGVCYLRDVHELLDGLEVVGVARPESVTCSPTVAGIQLTGHTGTRRLSTVGGVAMGAEEEPHTFDYKMLLSLAQAVATADPERTAGRRVWIQPIGDGLARLQIDGLPVRFQPATCDNPPAKGVVVPQATFASAIQAGLDKPGAVPAWQRSLVVGVDGDDVVIYARELLTTTITRMEVLGGNVTPGARHFSLPPADVARAAPFWREGRVQISWRYDAGLVVTLRCGHATLEVPALPDDRLLPIDLLTSRVELGVRARVLRVDLLNALLDCVDVLRPVRVTNPGVYLEVDARTLWLVPDLGAVMRRDAAICVDATVRRPADAQRLYMSVPALLKAVRDIEADELEVRLIDPDTGLTVASANPDEAWARQVLVAGPPY